jgi:hypothetical protein
MIKLRFRKWWWNLIPSFRKWLKQCEAQRMRIPAHTCAYLRIPHPYRLRLHNMNSDEVKQRYEFKNPSLPFYRALYGEDFPRVPKDFL